MRKRSETVSETEIMNFVANQDEIYQRQSAARHARRNDPANMARLEKVRYRMALSKVLYDARKQAELTQMEIAERMQTTQAYIAKMERGQINITLDTLDKYAKACGKELVISFG